MVLMSVGAEVDCNKGVIACVRESDDVSGGGGSRGGFIKCVSVCVCVCVCVCARALLYFAHLFIHMVKYACILPLCVFFRVRAGRAASGSV